MQRMASCLYCLLIYFYQTRGLVLDALQNVSTLRSFRQKTFVVCLYCIQLEIEAIIEEKGYAIPAFSHQCPHSCVRNALPGEDACHGLE